MSSRKSEVYHETAIKELLLKSGLECERPVIESVASSSSSESLRDEVIEENEELVEEIIQEETTEVIEEENEEIPDVFPTPSLRKLLPEHIRKIEELNSVHVLPNKFNSNIDPISIPIIAQTPQQMVIDILGQITGCKEYKRSLAEYWFLDTLANLLRRAQEDRMDAYSQTVLISWFCEWMKEVQHFDAADRKRMIRRFQDNMTTAARFVVEHHRLPTPAEVGVSYEAQDEVSTEGPSVLETDHLVTFGSPFQCALIDLTHIAHYIFDLFSTDYQYDLVRSVFTFTPQYTLVDGSHQMRVPKSLYTPKVVKTKKSPKKEKDKKGKKKEVVTEEYLALLELKAREDRELEERESKDQEEWNRRSHILPLSYAAGEELFNKYWPPMPEPEQSEVDLKQKAKAKKTKK